MSSRIVVSGASGLIGTALVTALENRGDDVVRLGRASGQGDATWNPESGRLDPSILAGADAVVCLNGAGIGDRRWTHKRKRLLRNSRITPTALIAETIAGVGRPPSVFVSGSAIGYYGDRGDTELGEGAPPGDDFLARLCVEWEEAASPAREARVRVVHSRTGIVLAAGGGALAPLLPIFKLGLGGPIGNGQQWWSWITLRDAVSGLMFLIDGDTHGPVNLVSPSPVRQRSFAKALGAQLHRPAAMPTPRFAVQARLGRELTNVVAFGSQRVIPQALQRAGFTFADADLEPALRSIFPD